MLNGAQTKKKCHKYKLTCANANSICVLSSHIYVVILLRKRVMNVLCIAIWLLFSVFRVHGKY